MLKEFKHKTVMLAAFLTDHFSRDTPHHLFVVNVQTKNWFHLGLFLERYNLVEPAKTMPKSLQHIAP